MFLFACLSDDLKTRISTFIYLDMNCFPKFTLNPWKKIIIYEVLVINWKTTSFTLAKANLLQVQFENRSIHFTINPR